MQDHNQFSTIEMSPAVIHQIMARISTHTVVATTNSGREKTVDQDRGAANRKQCRQLKLVTFDDETQVQRSAFLTHLSLGAASQLHPDGSTVLRTTALRSPPSVARRHQIDCAIRCLELRAVDSTAAPTDNSVLRAVDATDASFSDGELTAVGTPQQVAARFPSRKRIHLWARFTKPMS